MQCKASEASGAVFAPPARSMQADGSPCGAPLVILLIGMRGAGKTTLGRNAADMLGFEFADLDEVVTATVGKSPPAIVAEQGMPAFREFECDALEQAIRGKHTSNKSGVVACGGGIIETERGMTVLKKHWPVIFIDRHIDDILQCLAAPAAGHRFSLGEHPSDTYTRRLPRYIQCHDFRLPMQCGEVDKLHASRSLSRLLRFVTGRGGDVYVGPDTFLVSLTLPDLAAESCAIGPESLVQVASGADVLELRVDLLASKEHADIAQQVAILRRYACGAPILFTLRSRDHGGAFDGSEEDYVALNLVGLSLGCELLDVECTWSEAAINRIVTRRGRTLLVGSFHDFHRMPQQEELERLFQRCRLGGGAAVAKVVVKPRSREDSWLVQQAGAASGGEFIGLCLGDEGRLSRVLNRVLCPATHPSLSEAAPGQLPIKEVLACRRTLALLGSARQFAVLAPQKATAGVSDLMHRALTIAMQELKLPHVCRLILADTAMEARRVLSLASVGGLMLTSFLRVELCDIMVGAGQSGLSSPANALSVVSVVTRDENEVDVEGGAKISADSLEVVAFRERLKVLSLDVENGTGLVLQGEDAGGARGAGTAIEGTAAQVVLAELGMKRVLVHGNSARCVFLSPELSWNIELNRTNGEKLGTDVLDNENRDCIKVVSVKSGLMEEWNAANPDMHVRSGDIVAKVNDVSGDATAIVEECKKDKVLTMKVVRQLPGLKRPPSPHEHIEDLKPLAELQRLDVVIVASHIAPALEAELCSAIERLKPAVVVAPLPSSSVPLATRLVEHAKAAGCKVTSASDLLIEQACSCLAAWVPNPLSPEVRQKIEDVFLQQHGSSAE